MPNSANEFLAEIAAKVAASDAKADADLADILAGRPLKKRTPAPTTDEEGSTRPAAARKPRARRKPKTTEPS